MQRDKTNTIVAISTLTLGWSLTVAAFVLDPTGEVHDSILWVLGQSLTFSGSLLGAKSYIDYRTKQSSNNETETNPYKPI